MDIQLKLPDKEIAARRQDALEAARRYARKSRSDNTWRTYESAWRQFDDWCVSVALQSLPAEPSTVAMYVAQQADEGRAVATLEHRLAAIRIMHLGKGFPSPHNTLAVNDVMRGFRRVRAESGWAPARKAPAVDGLVKRMVDALDLTTRRGLRDRALLLYGFAGALRRSELVRIDVNHIEAHEKGHKLSVPISKGDQEGKGQIVPILAQAESSYCPVAALQHWLAAARIRDGAVFRRCFRSDVISDRRLSDRAVAEIIKDAIYRLHDETVQFKDYSGHSLRRGFLTSAGKEKADLLKLIAQSRHTRVDTVLSYIDNVSLFDNHAAERLLRSSTGSQYNKASSKFVTMFVDWKPDENLEPGDKERLCMVGLTASNQQGFPGLASYKKTRGKKRKLKRAGQLIEYLNAGKIELGSLSINISCI